MSEPRKHIGAQRRARDIARLTAEGLASREVARELGISHQRVCQIAERFSIPLARPGLRRFGCYISDRRSQMIRKLAEEAGVSPATMLERMARVILDDGIEAARKRLGKLSVPAVTYNKAPRS
jgi:hypothetical protein